MSFVANVSFVTTILCMDLIFEICLCVRICVKSTKLQSLMSFTSFEYNRNTYLPLDTQY